jgi:hypothetical protein
VSADLSQLVRLTRSGVEVRVSLLAGERDADAPFSESFREAGADLLLPLGRVWSLRLGGGFRRDLFDHRSSNLFAPLTGAPRRDETLRATAAVTWEIRQGLRGTARATVARRDSNVDLGSGQPDLDYRRATAVLGLSWVF